MNLKCSLALALACVASIAQAQTADVQLRDLRAEQQRESANRNLANMKASREQQKKIISLSPKRDWTINGVVLKDYKYVDFVSSKNKTKDTVKLHPGDGEVSLDRIVSHPLAKFSPEDKKLILLREKITNDATSKSMALNKRRQPILDKLAKQWKGQIPSEAIEKDKDLIKMNEEYRKLNEETNKAFDEWNEKMGWKQASLENAVGKWKIMNHAGDIGFYLTLADDMTAKKSHAPDATGKWSMKDNVISIEWSDGWKDVLTSKYGQIQKSAFSPGNWDKDPVDEGVAVRF